MQHHCPHNREVSCADCRLSGICLPLAVASDDIVKLDEIIRRGKPLQKGDRLYSQDGEFNAIYAVRSGALKAYCNTSSGAEQVTGFYLPGEILGMDGIANLKHASSAVALETSAICEIPFEQLGDLSLQLPNLQRHFFKILSREIADDQKLLTLVSKNTADERVAAFLLSLSARFARRQLSGEKFLLPMSRMDIGNFLGLTIETVSRVLGRFKKNIWIDLEGRDVRIQNIDALKNIAGVQM
ncbi:MAG: fumarate/nitrate reduction transcriptional regulator Fnr [Pseudomonadales bacterium]